MIELITSKKKLIREIFLYGIIGIASASLDSFLFLFLRDLKINLLVANFISINCGITLSFFLNTFVNFKMKDNLFKRAISFFSVGYIGLLLSTIILYIFVAKLAYSEFLVKIISIFVVALVQFILNKFVTFRKR